MLPRIFTEFIFLTKVNALTRQIHVLIYTKTRESCIIPKSWLVNVKMDLKNGGTK